MMHNGKVIHNFLDAEENFKTKYLDSGHRSFKLSTSRILLIKDLILKWSEDGVNKTVWRLTKLSTSGEYPNKIYTGEMKDLVFHNQITREIAQQIRLVDDDFVEDRIDG